MAKHKTLKRFGKELKGLVKATPKKRGSIKLGKPKKTKK